MTFFIFLGFLFLIPLDYAKNTGNILFSRIVVL